MREQRELRIDEVLEELYTLRDENAFLERQNTALKMRCSKYCLQVRELESELTDLKFIQKNLLTEADPVESMELVE